MITKQLAGCVITDKSGKVLLIHRNTPRLVQWELPGGKVEPGETFAETAERETLKEIGVKVAADKEFGMTKFEDDGINWEYHWFAAKISDGKAEVMEPNKFDDIAFFNLHEPDLSKNKKLSPNIINLINYLQENGINISDLARN